MKNLECKTLTVLKSGINKNNNKKMLNLVLLNGNTKCEYFQRAVDFASQHKL